MVHETNNGEPPQTSDQTRMRAPGWGGGDGVYSHLSAGGGPRGGGGGIAAPPETLVTASLTAEGRNSTAALTHGSGLRTPSSARTRLRPYLLTVWLAFGRHTAHRARCTH